MTRPEAERRVIECARDLLSALQARAFPYSPSELELRKALNALDALPADDGWRQFKQAVTDIKLLHQFSDAITIECASLEDAHVIYTFLEALPGDGLPPVPFPSPPDDGGRG